MSFPRTCDHFFLIQHSSSGRVLKKRAVFSITTFPILNPLPPGCFLNLPMDTYNICNISKYARPDRPSRGIKHKINMKKRLHTSVNLVAILLLYVTTGNYLQAIQTKYLIETIHTKVKM
jgi:hypothetical protein